MATITKFGGNKEKHLSKRTPCQHGSESVTLWDRVAAGR